jgi:hypothetical protein
MKTIITALLVSAISNPVIKTEGGATFEILADTSVTRVNDLGATQTSSIVVFTPAGGKPTAKVAGVLGCGSGSGVIVLFDLAHNVESGPHSWRAGGPRVFDGVAEAACSSAALNANRLLRGRGGMV